MIRSPVKDMVFFGGLFVLKPGVDSIALDKQGEWLYFSPMAHETMFRVRTSDLNDASLSVAELSQRVERFGPKPLSDGLSMDHAGNIYITDVEHSAILALNPRGELSTVIRDNRMRWPDALSFGPDNYLYIADSAIPDLMLQSKAHIAKAAPYYLFRFKPGPSGAPGQ